MRLRFTLNGQPVAREVDPARRVVDFLREDLGLTGVKESCGSGECGACTILLDGRAVPSCLLLAAQLEGRRVTTIEGVATAERPHPLPAAFAAHGAVQCGFCTPGMILSSLDLLSREPHPDEAAIREALSGNLCRCTGYQKIIKAVAAASRPAEAPERKP